MKAELGKKYVIWKYELEIGMMTLDIPKYADILDFQWQGGPEVAGGSAVIWALVEVDGDRPRYPNAARRMHLLMTGQRFTGSGERYHGTIQTPAGYVFHLFEEVE